MPPSNSSGETYSLSSRTPKCRQAAEQWPGSSAPITSPRCTTSPSATAGVTGSKLDSSPPGWAIETSGRSTTTPAKCTVPSAGARTTASGAPMSMPRCPGE